MTLGIREGSVAWYAYWLCTTGGIPPLLYLLFTKQPNVKRPSMNLEAGDLEAGDLDVLATIFL